MFDQASHDQLLYGRTGYDRLTHEQKYWLATAPRADAPLGEAPLPLHALSRDQGLVFLASDGSWRLTATGVMRWREMWESD